MCRTRSGFLTMRRLFSRIVFWSVGIAISGCSGTSKPQVSNKPQVSGYLVCEHIGISDRPIYPLIVCDQGISEEAALALIRWRPNTLTWIIHVNKDRLTECLPRSLAVLEQAPAPKGGNAAFGTFMVTISCLNTTITRTINASSTLKILDTIPKDIVDGDPRLHGSIKGIKHDLRFIR